MLSSILLRYASLVFGQVHRGGGHVPDGTNMGRGGGSNSSTSTPNELSTQCRILPLQRNTVVFAL